MGARYPGWGILPPRDEDTQGGGQDTPGYLHPRGASCQGGQDKLLHRTPLIKGMHQLNPQNLSSTTTAIEGKKKTS